MNIFNLQHELFRNRKEYFALPLICIFFSLFSPTVALLKPLQIIKISSQQIAEAPKIGLVHSIWPSYTHYFQIVDVNGDGALDIAAFVSASARASKYISVRTMDERVIDEIHLDRSIDGTLRCLDLNQDGFLEVLYLTHENFTAYLNVRDIRKQRTRRIEVCRGQDLWKDGAWDIYLYDAKLLHHSSGETYLLLLFGAGHDGQPRGIYALDAASLMPRWTYLIGSRPIREMVIEDINGDKKEEILFSTSAPYNGYTLGGFADTVSYFIMLNENGQDKFHKEIGGKYSYSFFQLLEPQHDILIYGYSKDAFSGQPNIYQMRNGDWRFLKAFQKINPRQRLLLPAGNKIRPFSGTYFAYGDRYGSVFILNDHFELDKRLQFNEPVRSVGLYDVNNDGRTEVCVVLGSALKGKWTALLFDQRLNLLGKQLFQENVFSFQYSQFSRGGSRFYFLSPKTRSIHEWYIPASQLIPVSGWAYFLRNVRRAFWPIAGGLSTVFVFGLIAFYMQRKSWAARRFHELSRFLLDLPGEAILIISADGKIEDCNQAFVDLFHVQRENSSPRKDYWEFLSISEANFLVQPIAEALRGQLKAERQVIVVNVPVRGDVHKFKVRINRMAGKDEGDFLIIRLDDLTSIAKGDRVAAWASLAQMLAHEIKNPLMSMTLALGRLEKKIHAQSIDASDLAQQDKYLQFIRDDIEQMRNTANNFMRFTSVLNLQVEALQINDIIREIIASCEQMYGARIQFNLKLKSNLPSALVDREQTRHILYNILINAIEAIETKGTIEVQTTPVEQVDHVTGRIRVFAQVEISDDGCGMSANEVEKVFTPGFSKKSTGAGFGMAIAKHVVEAQGGSIAVRSKLDVGTTVRLLLPVSALGESKMLD